MGTNAPERIETARLILRRPLRRDAEAIFSSYASDLEVTRYLAWHRHLTLQDTRGFLEFSDAEWDNSPGGPYLIERRDSRQVIGSTGIAFETEYRASTGYVLGRDSWGKGFASEALLGIVDASASIGLARLYALCHIEHSASCHVLEKCGFVREGVLYGHTMFPNLDEPHPCDVISYSRVLNTAR